MINANKIRGRIKELGTTQEKVAELIGMSAKTFSIKMNNGKFGLDEAERMIKVLKIEKPDKYFFASEVTYQDTNEKEGA